MAIPSYVKIKKDGVELVSGLDRCQYTIKELSRAALKDVGKLVAKRTRAKIPRVRGFARRNVQYWVRAKQEFPDLRVGYKQGKGVRGFYARFFETGSDTTPPLRPLYSAVSENIDDIRRIEGQYLSAIEDENRAIGLIDEKEEISDDE